jgi:hypothetical protein
MDTVEQNNQSFEQQYASTLRFLQCISGQVGERFSNPTMTAHDRRLVNQCLELGDEKLAAAAALHGLLDLSLVDQLAGFAGREVDQILSTWRRLRSLDHRDADLRDHLSQTLLPALVEVRGAVLVLLEICDRLDPTGEFAKFSAESHSLSGDRPDILSWRPPLWITQPEDEAGYAGVVGTEIAQFLGLWPESSCCDDLGLYYQEPARFDRIFAFRQRVDVADEVHRRIDGIRGVLGDLGDAEVVWEWHHSASFSRKLGNTAGEGWLHRLSALGMVTVICPGSETTYTALGKLHQRLKHQSLDIGDTIGQLLVPRNQSEGASHYEAIHTLVTLPINDIQVRLRLIPRHSHLHRHARLNAAEFRIICERHKARSGSGLRVFAFDGRSYLLQPGSTVLNFAYHFLKRSVAFATGALVNREPVGLLHRLNDGDVIRLQVGDHGRELPSEWEKEVPPNTVQSIRREFRRYSRPAKQVEGRRNLREWVTKYTDISGLDDASFDSYCEDSILRHSRAPRHLDELYQRCSAQNFAFTAEPWVKVLADRIGSEDLVQLDMLTIPNNLLNDFRDLQTCAQCSPTVGQPIVGDVNSEGILIIHAARARKCASSNSQPLAWHRESLRGQFFVIEMTNRQGIAAEILGAAATSGVDLVNIAGATLGRGWAVLRLHLRPLLRDQIRNLTARIREVPGVLRVLSPDQPSLPILEANLPPRQQRRDLAPKLGLLFPAGPIVVDPDLFYGRDIQLGLLREALAQAGQTSMFVFVKGPYRIGKSSLVHQFILESRRTEFNCADVMIRAKRGESWSRIRPLIKEQVENILRAVAPEALAYANLPIEELVMRLPRITGKIIIVFIDEAVGLLQESEAAGEDRELMSFLETLLTVPHLLLVFAGPEAPVEDLRSPFRGLLARACQVPLGGLNRDDVYRLLAAEKLNYRGVALSVGKEVSNKVFRFTGGNPYWCNLIASDAVTNTKNTTLSEESVALAMDTLLSSAFAFQDRLVESAPRYRNDASRILSHLATQRLGSSAADLTQRLRLEHPEKLGNVLQRLCLRGSTKFTKGKWRISSPALAEHVVAFQGTQEYV